MAFLRDDLAQLAAYKSPHPIAEDTLAGNSSHQGSVQPVLDPLDTNESPTDLPDEIKADLAEAYQSAIEANRYPDGTCILLKQAVMRYVAGSGNISPETITAENITLGNGSDELIRSVIMATCLGGHGSILVADPTFSMYAILAKTLGVKVHHVSRDDSFAVDLAAAQAAIDSAQSDGLPVRTIFMVHPNSPTGNALTAAEQTWLKQLPENILVVVDEAYFEFSGHTMLAEALSRPNWLVTRTFSKAFRLAAHRVGYGIGHPAIIAALEKLRLPYNLPSFSQAAAMAALVHSDSLLAQIPTIVAERDRLLDVLSQHPYLRVWPSDSNFVYVQLSDRGLAALESTQSEEGLRKVFVALREKGTLIRHTGGGLRISIGTASENNRTLANLQQVLGSKP
ncbi:MAG: histidinol-phosphate transaminase [Cyanobacteria bacterium J06634_5]